AVGVEVGRVLLVLFGRGALGGHHPFVPRQGGVQAEMDEQAEPHPAEPGVRVGHDFTSCSTALLACSCSRALLVCGCFTALLVWSRATPPPRGRRGRCERRAACVPRRLARGVPCRRRGGSPPAGRSVRAGGPRTRSPGPPTIH